MPLLPILEKLPPDLRSKWLLGGVDLRQATVSISVEKVLPQLALGAVKITFGELRHAAPSLFRTGEEYDSLPIALPLNEVLSRLNPTLIARNPAQKAVTAPAEVAEPFGPGGQGATLLKPTPPTTHFFKKTAPPSEPIKMPDQQPSATPLAFAHRGTVPLSSTPGTSHINRPTTPATPGTSQLNRPPASGTPGTSHLNRASVPTTPGTSHINRMAQSFSTPISPPPATPAVRPPIPFLAANTPPPARPEVPKAPAAPEVPSILAPLDALAESWPESLRHEIVQLNLAGAQVALPIHLVEPALKRGRVIISWHNVRSWIRPSPPGVSVHDAIELELPLKVLAPLFVPKRPAAPRLQGKAPLPPENVPNLFFGFPKAQPESLPAIDPLPAAGQPGQPIHATPLTKSLEARLAETNYYELANGAQPPQQDETDYKRPMQPATDFSHRRAMPKEIIDHAIKLPGVTGAIIALPDGLKVAYQLPPELNPDTVAAFLPQLFSRVSLCSKELRMGELNNLNFTIGNTPWKIFRVNAVYFAAFGRAGEPLPTAQLAMLAGELDRKK
jgi:predicted regulator of Ras-like GTPase activity (Roadblock/LC7/MglB family)